MRSCSASASKNARLHTEAQEACRSTYACILSSSQLRQQRLWRKLQPAHAACGQPLPTSPLPQRRVACHSFMDALGGIDNVFTPEVATIFRQAMIFVRL